MECLLLVAIMGIMAVASGQALQTIAKSPGQNDQAFQIETQLLSKMESIRAMSFDGISLGSPNSTLSDSVIVSGQTYQRTVNVALVDGTGDGVADVNLKQVTVTCGGQSVSTLVTR
jgi:hypothetical protein